MFWRWYGTSDHLDHLWSMSWKRRALTALTHVFWKLEDSKSQLQTSWTLLEAAKTPEKTELHGDEDLFIVNLATQFLAAWMSCVICSSCRKPKSCPQGDIQRLWLASILGGFWLSGQTGLCGFSMFLQRCAGESRSSHLTGAWLCWMENCEAGHGLCSRLSQLKASCIYHIFACA